MPALRNTTEYYGLISILLHWLVALTVFGLITLGLWMVDLNYYSPWYKLAPFWHKSIGLSLAAILLARLLWRMTNPQPKAPAGHHRREVQFARAVHALLYLMLFVILISGYLISTAKGQGISVFGWFELPALITGLPRQADRAGAVHYWLAMAVLALVVLHILGALKHHFIDRDTTLIRMLRPGSTHTKENRNE
ncbi:cytochrome b [Marinobacterium sp. MBR-109]|jgi:cytochrome b561|uniref:cytochrome b n=1 Tax=Marinobacterium sp. MBR-109 TaxID=3156462 RepID=UPI00339A648C